MSVCSDHLTTDVKFADTDIRRKQNVDATGPSGDEACQARKLNIANVIVPEFWITRAGGALEFTL